MAVRQWQCGDGSGEGRGEAMTSMNEGGGEDSGAVWGGILLPLGERQEQSVCT